MKKEGDWIRVLAVMLLLLTLGGPGWRQGCSHREGLILVWFPPVTSKVLPHGPERLDYLSQVPACYWELREPCLFSLAWAALLYLGSGHPCSLSSSAPLPAAFICFFLVLHLLFSPLAFLLSLSSALSFFSLVFSFLLLFPLSFLYIPPSSTFSPSAHSILSPLFLSCTKFWLTAYYGNCPEHWEHTGGSSSTHPCTELETVSGLQRHNASPTFVHCWALAALPVPAAIPGLWEFLWNVPVGWAECGSTAEKWRGTPYSEKLSWAQAPHGQLRWGELAAHQGGRRASGQRSCFSERWDTAWIVPCEPTTDNTHPNIPNLLCLSKLSRVSCGWYLNEKAGAVSSPCHGCAISGKSWVRVNFMCHLEGATRCPGIWLNTISGCVNEDVSGWD